MIIGRRLVALLMTWSQTGLFCPSPFASHLDSREDLGLSFTHELRRVEIFSRISQKYFTRQRLLLPVRQRLMQIPSLKDPFIGTGFSPAQTKHRNPPPVNSNIHYLDACAEFHLSFRLSVRGHSAANTNPTVVHVRLPRMPANHIATFVVPLRFPDIRIRVRDELLDYHDGGLPSSSRVLDKLWATSLPHVNTVQGTPGFVLIDFDPVEDFESS